MDDIKRLRELAGLVDSSDNFDELVAKFQQEAQELINRGMTPYDAIAELAATHTGDYEATAIDQVMHNMGIGPTTEGYKVMPPIDRERYTDLSYQGLEGPFTLDSGKVVYYDPKQGQYYDRDTDMYLSHDEYMQHNLSEEMPDRSSSMHPVNTIRDVISHMHPIAFRTPEEHMAAVAKEVPSLARHPEFENWFIEAFNDFYVGNFPDDDDEDFTDYSMRQGEMGNPDRAEDENWAKEKNFWPDAWRGDEPEDDEEDRFDEEWSEEIDEALPAKAMSVLRTAKDNIAKSGEVEPAPKVSDKEAYYSTTSPEEWLKSIARKSGREVPDEILNPDAPPKSFTDLSSELEVLNRLIAVKGEIENLVPKAEKWGPLPSSLKVDLDDSHIKQKDYETLLQHGERGLARLKQYLDMKKALYRKKTTREGTEDMTDLSEIKRLAGIKTDELDEDLSNGYGSEKYACGDDYFPDGADGPVVDAVGPSGAKQGDNPEQKKMEVAETHKELVYAYRKFLKESK